MALVELAEALVEQLALGGLGGLGLAHRRLSIAAPAGPAAGRKAPFTPLRRAANGTCGG